MKFINIKNSFVDDLLEQEYINLLKQTYLSKNNLIEISENNIMFIFFMRAFIYTGIYKKISVVKNITEEDISTFLHKELKLDDCFLFDNTVIKNTDYSEGNNTINIIDSWKYSYLKDINKLKSLKSQNFDNVQNVMQTLFDKYKSRAEQKLSRFNKSTKFKTEEQIYLMFKFFEDDFDFIIKEPPYSKHISYKIAENKKSVLEEFNDYHNLFVKYNGKISEKDVENYIMLNFKDIFPFIERINNQFKIENNIIDIIGFNDSTQEIFIFEIKNKKKPKDLIFQLKEYKYCVEKTYKNRTVKIISVTPPLPENYIRELKEISAEMYFFNKIDGEIIFEKYN